MKPDIKKAISIEDNEESENEEEAEAEIEEKPNLKSKKPKKKKTSKRVTLHDISENYIKSQEMRQQQEQEAYAPEIIPEAHKIYRELKKIRKLLSTFKEVEIKYDRGNVVVNALSPPVIPFKPLKKLGDYKEAPAQNITPQALQTQIPAPVLQKVPSLANIPFATAVAEQVFSPPLPTNPTNPNEIILDNSQPEINLKRCPNCNKKFKSFFGLFGKGRSKIIQENGEVRQTLFCKKCGWHKEIRFVL